MTDYKYPYIPKEYYAAVMFACKIIRETGQMNRAIKTASRYYKVDEEELEKHVRARQAAGQKGKKRGKYYWYAVRFYLVNETYGCDYDDSNAITVKATSEKNAIGQILKRYGSMFDNLRNWAEVVEVECFDSKEDAEKKVKEWSE